MAYMEPDEESRLTKQLGNGLVPPEKSLLGTALAMLASAVLLVLAFTFSLLILAAAAIVGMLVFGYVWWKTRTLRRQIREQMDYQAQQRSTPPPMDGGSPDGNIIEGEVIREKK